MSLLVEVWPFQMILKTPFLSIFFFAPVETSISDDFQRLEDEFLLKVLDHLFLWLIYSLSITFKCLQLVVTSSTSRTSPFVDIVEFCALKS